MNSEEALARLRSLRYSPTRGKKLGLAYIASRAGCSTMTLYRAIETGKLSPTVTLGVAKAFQHITSVEKDNAPRATLLRSMFTPAELAKLPRS